MWLIGGWPIGLIILISAITIPSLIWMARSIRVVGPDERAVKVIFGEPVAVYDSGRYFDIRFPLPTCYLVRFPKKLYNLAFPTREVISREGKYGDREYGAQVLRVKLVMYLRFPRGNNLIEALRARVSTEERALMDFFEEISVGSLRVVLGNMTWREAIEKREEIRQQTEEEIKNSEMFQKTGFSADDMSLVIQEIELPGELEGMLPKIDIERIEAEAAQFEAQQVSMETIGTIVQMMAESRGLTQEEIQEKINKNTRMQREFLDLAKDLIIRQMGSKRGAYVDIRVEGAEGLERTILNALAVWQKIPKGRGGDSDSKKVKITQKDIDDERERFRQAIEETQR